MQLGRDATVDALVYAWRNWKRVAKMENPVGYLYRVGSSSVRRPRDLPQLELIPEKRDPWIEPQLEASLHDLSEQQRTIVVLRHSFEWTYDEIAELLEVSVSTIRTQLTRGMEKLRAALEVTIDG
jgi:RNA polymerase sigma factor (sigma-70 family)